MFNKISYFEFNIVCLNSGSPVRGVVSAIDLLIILLHPVIAVFVIIWILRINGKFGNSNQNLSHAQGVSKGKERTQKKIYLLSWILVITGFGANIAYNIRLESWSLSGLLFPGGAGSLHTAGGVFGLGLLTYLRFRKNDHRSPLFRDSKEGKQGLKFQDMILIVIVVHAFLGFLWLLELLP